MSVQLGGEGRRAGRKKETKGATQRWVESPGTEKWQSTEGPEGRREQGWSQVPAAKPVAGCEGPAPGLAPHLDTSMWTNSS